MSQVGVKEEFGGFKAYTVCLVSALFFFFVFIQMNCWNVLSHHYSSLFNLSNSQAVGLFQMYFIGNVLCLFPAGLLLDRVSTRWVLVTAMLVAVLAVAGFSFATELWQVKLSRFLIGCCGSFCLLAPVRLISRWFPAEKIALMVGLVVTLAMLGGMVAQAPLRYLVSSFNFATAMKINIAFGVGCWLLILFVVRDSPAGRDIDADAHAELSDMGFFSSVYQVLRNSQNWLAGIYASLINLPVFWLGGYKGGDYLQQVDHLTAKQSVFVVGLLFIGLIFGAPLFGYFSDKIKRRRLPMIVGACASILVTVLITWVDIQSESLLAILFFLLGIVISSQVIAYPLVVESNSLSLTGTAEGVTSVLIMSGGLTTSIMLMFLEKGKTGLHSTVFSALGWHWALSALIGCFVVALFLSMAIRETRCKHCESK